MTGATLTAHRETNKKGISKLAAAGTLVSGNLVGGEKYAFDPLK
jgi:hypothetical protein